MVGWYLATAEAFPQITPRAVAPSPIAVLLFLIFIMTLYESYKSWWYGPRESNLRSPTWIWPHFDLASGARKNRQQNCKLLLDSFYQTVAVHNYYVCTNYPVNAEVAISMMSLAPIRCAFWLKMGLTVCTPMQSGMSCLLASTSRGTPVRCSDAIILSTTEDYCLTWFFFHQR